MQYRETTLITIYLFISDELEVSPILFENVDEDFDNTDEELQHGSISEPVELLVSS